MKPTKGYHDAAHGTANRGNPTRGYHDAAHGTANRGNPTRGYHDAAHGAANRRKENPMMQAQIKEWGNSQGVRIPKELLQDAGISLNEILNITVSDGTIILTKMFRHRTLEERAAEYGGRLSLDGEYDWGEPVGREVWQC